MGNQQSSSSSQPQSPPTPSSPNSQQNGQHSKSNSSYSGKFGFSRGTSQTFHRFFQPTSSSSPGAAGSHSESSSAYEYALTPSTSLSPSLTRIETHHRYDHKHGSSIDSYLAGEHKSQPLPGPYSTTDFSVASNSTDEAAMGAASSAEKLPKQKAANRDKADGGSPHSNPVAVPTRTRSQRQRESTPHHESPGMFKPSAPPPTNGSGHRESVSSVSSSYTGPGQPIFTQPPRLPLPIQEEELEPGSPVMAAGDFHGFEGGPPIGIENDLELVEGLVHSKSLLSQTTADEEEDEEERGPFVYPGTGNLSGNIHIRAVPTEVIWRGHGDKIYLTGTFVNWGKKFRMNRDPKTGIAKTTVELGPGTHHVRFIVDGDMQLSNDLPTAVDYTNSLVNYIEVSADAAYSHGRSQVRDDAANRLSAPPADLHPPLTLPPFEPGHEHAGSGSRSALHEPQEWDKAQSKPKGPELMEPTTRNYGQLIPQYLSDLDRDEKTARFARAQGRVDQMAPPPTLPGFLSKSVLNMSTPAKDDSSILHKPNHTMLNHLATSSIRQGVLATSLTTRYKRKYVTWITYRPTSTDD